MMMRRDQPAEEVLVEIRSAFSEPRSVRFLPDGGGALASTWRDEWLELARVVAPNQVKCYVGNTVQKLHTATTGRFGEIRHIFDTKVLDETIGSGGTIVLEEIGPALECAGEWIRALETLSNERVWANIFVSFGSGGIAPHWDDNDVTIVQLRGDRSWIISAPNPTDPISLNVQPVDHTQPTSRYLLTRGDLLCVPRGFVHSTEVAAGKVSMHLMMAFRRRTVWDFLHWVVDELAAKNTALRKDLEPLTESAFHDTVTSLVDPTMPSLARRYLADRCKHVQDGRDAIAKVKSQCRWHSDGS
jgi:hypothetical protein